jgi:superfamily II DNA or RNA helicase
MSVVVTVDNRIRIREDALSSDAVDALTDKFTRTNPDFFKLRRMGMRTWGAPAKIKMWRREGPEITFPRGAWDDVRDVLRAMVGKYEIRDRRERGHAAPEVVSKVDARDYQEEALPLILQKENGIIRFSTGAGKTTFGLMFAGAVKTATLILVDKGGIADEWERRAFDELGVKVGYYGGGRKTVRPITVALHQAVNAMKPEAVAAFDQMFGAVITDEVQVLGAKTYGNNVDRMRARYRLGLSDDHHRADGKTFVVTGIMGPVIYKIGDRKLIDQGAIVDVNVIADPTDFVAPWYSDGRIDEETGEQLPVTGEDFNRLLDEMTASAPRNAKICDRIAHQVGLGRTFLIFSHREAHCRALTAQLIARGVPAGLMLGGTKEFDETRQGILSGLVKAGVGTLQALGKGINVPAVDSGYATTPVTSSTQVWRQVKGRIVRPKDHDAEMWVAWDRYVDGDRMIRQLSKWHRKKLVIAIGSLRLTPSEYVKLSKENGERNDRHEEDHQSTRAITEN